MIVAPLGADKIPAIGSLVSLGYTRRVQARKCDHERSVGTSNGVEYLYCKSCHLARTKRRRARVLADTRAKLTAYLDLHPCVDCGERDHRTLHFDHRDPDDKTLGIARMLSRAYKWDAVLKEIQKCEVRCANCHAKRTAEQYGWWNNDIGTVAEPG